MLGLDNVSTLTRRREPDFGVVLPYMIAVAASGLALGPVWSAGAFPCSPFGLTYPLGRSVPAAAESLLVVVGA